MARSPSAPGLWRRFRQMSWDEVRERAWQEIGKRSDAIFYAGGDHRSAYLDFLLPAQVRFFFDHGELFSLVKLMNERLPEEVQATVTEAESILQHRFRLLGYEGLDYGPEIDWHRDAVHGKRAPLKPWFKIDYLDFEQVGDHKLIWELNRHQHLVTLAKAYCFTGEVRLARELAVQWYDWQRQNPYPLGINWASSLEVAFRSLSWLWLRHLLEGCPEASHRFLLDLRRAQALNGRHLEKYLSTYFSPNTHLIGEGVALFFLGTLYPELPGAAAWRARGWKIVLDEARRQVEPDGMHFEQSLYYHVYTLDFFLHARTLAVRNGMEIPVDFDRTLTKMLDLLLALSTAGPPATFGDDDGGRVFNPRRNRARHLADPLATGAAIFGRADFKSAAGGLREEMVWLLGVEGVARFDELPSAEPAPSSAGFEASGIYVMGEPEARMVIRAGPMGAGSAGHSHADALSVQLACGRRDWLIDPGTCSYVGPERDAFRGTAAHNTLRVDGVDQAEPAGPFRWTALPRVRVEQWIAGRGFDLLIASHEGYTRLAKPLVHRRTVFYVKGQFWLVHDATEGEGQHELELLWHLAPGTVAGSSSNSAVEFREPEGLCLTFLALEDRRWERQLVQSVCSPAYGAKESAPMVRFRVTTGLPVDFAALLAVRAPGPVAGRLLALGDAEPSGAVRGYLYQGPEARHFIFLARGGRAWRLGAWASDARFLYCCVSREPRRQHWVLCGGTHAENGEHVALRCQRTVERCEWRGREQIEERSCSDESAIGQIALPALPEEDIPN